jgi:hypothetical protein
LPVFVPQKIHIKQSPNGTKLSGYLSWPGRNTRSFRREPGAMPHRPLAPFDLIPPLYIPSHPETLGRVHEILFPPPQASILERSHLEAFFGTLSEEELITEGLYIILVALPMMHE